MTETEYAKKRSNLRAYVLRRKRERVRHDHVRALIEESNITFEEEALRALLGQITGSGMIESEEAFRRLLGAPLLQFGPPEARRLWSVETFRERAALTSDEQRAQVRTRDDLVDFAGGLVVREVMMERAEQRGLADTPAFEQALLEAMDDYVLDRVRERMNAQVTVPEDSMRAYFETAPPGEFMQPEQVQVSEIVLATRAEAEQIKARLASTDFATLAREHSLRPGARQTNGDLGFLDATQLGPAASTIFDATAGEVLGPLDMQGHVALLKVGERRAARPMTYDEARSQIAALLRYRYTRVQRRAVYDELHTRYTIDVDTDLLYSMPLAHGNED